MKEVKVTLKRAGKVLDQVKKLSEDLDKIENNPVTNALKVDDIYLPLNHLFNYAAKRAFENVVKTTVMERELKVISTTKRTVIDQVKYFGAMAVGDRKIFDAAQKVANCVNECANKGHVTGVLAKLMIYPLATEPHQVEKYLILSYVALSPEGLRYLEENPSKTEFEIGGIPNNCDDI